jgi:outer membrane protein OmpA-like peptidoglycan-associated protein
VLNHELVYGVGARYRVADGLHVHAELYGASNFADFGDKHLTPFELLAGPKYQHEDWFFGVAAGLGLVRGYGSPDVRLVTTAGYAPVIKAKPKQKEKQKPTDSDGDGFLDPDDGCPFEPEDRDQFEDENGCPEPDNDQDGVLDVADACPLEPEDKDGFEDQNGCPDPDNDNDAVLDVADACPLEPEDKDGFEDKNGCPEPDNDKDLVADVEDTCPDVAGLPKYAGCPPKALEIVGGKLVLLGRVEFATDKDVILPSSGPVLDKVLEVLNESPEFRRIRIEGHTDSMGKVDHNLDLSRRRARSVGKWLIERGIAAERLEAWGCGLTLPIATNDTKQGRQENRRVEFHIVDPPAPEPRNPATCVEIDLE